MTASRYVLALLAIWGCASKTAAVRTRSSSPQEASARHTSEHQGRTDPAGARNGDSARDHAVLRQMEANSEMNDCGIGDTVDFDAYRGDVVAFRFEELDRWSRRPVFSEMRWTVDVQAFSLDTMPVSNVEFAECVESGTCEMSASPEEIDGDCAAMASQNPYQRNCITVEQAEAYCAWKGKRLPTSDEYGVVFGSVSLAYVDSRTAWGCEGDLVTPASRRSHIEGVGRRIAWVAEMGEFTSSRSSSCPGATMESDYCVFTWYMADYERRRFLETPLAPGARMGLQMGPHGSPN